MPCLLVYRPQGARLGPPGLHAQHGPPPSVINRLIADPKLRRQGSGSRGSSRYNITAKRDIQKLPALKGVFGAWHEGGVLP